MNRTIAADPFTIAVSDDELADLKKRLANTRFPNEPDGNGN
ncbi:MAG: epoxide hydrolase N-terminal domain-containing protein [Candidatus Phaeomarinobacter sp.]